MTERGPSNHTVPRGKSLVYYQTTAEKLPELEQNGITTSWGESRADVEAAAECLETVSESSGLEYPLDRRLAVRLIVNPVEADVTVTSEVNDVLAPQGVLVIDISAVDAPLTVASTMTMFNLLSSLAPKVYDGHPVEGLTPAHEYAEEYLESIVVLDSWADIESAIEDIQNPELLVSGDIASEAIIDTVSAVETTPQQ